MSEATPGAAAEFIKSVSSSGLKTLTAKSTGTIYAVVAEAKGLALCITPKIAIGNPLGILCRVRAQKQEDWANIAESKELFGFPELEETGPDHYRTDLYIAVGLQPATPYDIGKIIADNKLISRFSDFIASRLSSAKISLLADPAVLDEYLRNVLEDRLPSAPPKEIKLEEFPVVVGMKNIEERLLAIHKKYLTKTAKPA